MDPHYDVTALLEVHLLASGTQPACGACSGAATRRVDGEVQKPNRRHVRCVGGVCTSDSSHNGRGRCDQASANHGTDRRRARAAAYSCAAKHRISLRQRRDQANRTDQFNRDCAVIPRSSGVDSEGDEVELIRVGRGGRHVDEIVSTEVPAVCLQEAEDASFYPVCASLCQTSSKDRSCKARSWQSADVLVMIVPRTTKVVP